MHVQLSSTILRAPAGRWGGCTLACRTGGVAALLWLLHTHQNYMLHMLQPLTETWTRGTSSTNPSVDRTLLLA
jgi:hypothetical protein